MRRIFITTVILFFPFQIWAEQPIHITVNTTEDAATGIGYSVEGKRSGTLGRSYTGTGIKNKEYVFGYRKHSINGVSINCGSIILTKDSTVTLVSKGDKCLSVLNEKSP